MRRRRPHHVNSFMTFSCLLAALVVSLSNAAGGGHGLVVDDVAGAAGGRAAHTAAAQAVVVEIDAATGEMSEVKRDVDQTDDPMTSTMSTTSDANDATSSSSAASTAENEEKKNDTHNKPNSRTIAATATATTTSAASAAAAETTADNTETTTETPLQLDCGIWLAPSVLEGAGLGMYAGRNFSKGERLQTRGDLAIPIVDIVAHNRYDGESGLFEFLWDEYTWNAADLSMEQEGYFDVNGASPGFGSAANSFLPLKNVAESYVDVDSAGLHRKSDPGAGSFTYYHNRKSVAIQDIVAFEELYVDYGEDWFRMRPFLGPIPLHKDLSRARAFFRQYMFMLEATKKNGVTEEIHDEIWDVFIRNTTYTRSRVLGSFHHHNPDELKLLKENPDIKELRRKQAIRTREWLEQHGTCGDHLRAGPSTLRQAGRGAFATRDLPKGTIVAHLPLIHIPRKDRFTMYKLGKENNDGVRSPKRELGTLPTQLLHNYCYGHGESSLLLCPYGPIVNHVNHNQTLVNVRIQWADPARGNQMSYLLEEPLETGLEKDSKTAKLAFEMVALRDIAENEEIFLDYGDEWEQAWQYHVVNWKPVPGASEYLSGLQLTHSEEPVRTSFEQIDNPYPSNVILQCNYYFAVTKPKVWKNHLYAGTLKDVLSESDDVEFGECDVLRAETLKRRTRYTVVFYTEGEEGPKKVTDVPRDVFRFVDRPYTSDMFMDNAFRHDIRIPDEMFPQAWRNIRT